MTQVRQNNLPKSLKDFWLYYYRFDPKTWWLFLFQDLIHFTRYQISFVLIGVGVDILIAADPSTGVPTAAWYVVLGISFVLGFAESMHIWTANILRKWKPRMRKQIRRDFFEYVMGHSHSYFQDHFAGAIARRVTEIAESSYRLHEHLRFNIFGSLVLMIATMIGMILISPPYAVGLAVFILAVTLPIILRLKRIGSRARDFSAVRSDVTGTIVDILTNSAAMRNFARFDYEMDNHRTVSRREETKDSKRMLTLIQIENYRRVCLVLLGSFMMASLVYGWSKGIVSVGDIGAIMGLSLSLTGTVWYFSMGVVMTADELGYIDDAIRVLTVPHQITDKDGAKDLQIGKGHIEFKDVKFEYTGQNKTERAVFNGLSVEIPAKRKIGILGPSGAGKSTFVNLLLRLYDIQGGEIEIDGQNIADVTQDSLRSQIAMIPQDTSLFHRSLMDNIRYGRLEATDDEVMDAAKCAHAHEFISELTEGYATMVGERGIKLSGGQRQRIVIARAILKDAPILVLDEATSALDSESEKLIQDSLKDLMDGKTVIAIAHRLSTISHLDHLIVMDEGQIVEHGTHEELRAQNSIYAKLWNMQSGGFLGE